MASSTSCFCKARHHTTRCQYKVQGLQYQPAKQKGIYWVPQAFLSKNDCGNITYLTLCRPEMRGKKNTKLYYTEHIAKAWISNKSTTTALSLSLAIKERESAECMSSWETVNRRECQKVRRFQERNSWFSKPFWVILEKNLFTAGQERIKLNLIYLDFSLQALSNYRVKCSLSKSLKVSNTIQT